MVSRLVSTPGVDSTLPVTVADAIGMTTVGNARYRFFKHRVAQFSPDGKRFVIVVKRGNIKTNTNDYSLFLFRTGDVLKAPVPEILAAFSSSSNRDAIRDVKWLDNQSLAFLGERSGDLQQLYEVNCDTKQLTRLTNHATSLVSFAITNGGGIVFGAERAGHTMLTERAKREGIVVSTQPLWDLIAGSLKDGDDVDIFLRRRRGDRAVPIETGGTVLSWSPLLPSPNGDFLVVLTRVAEVPEMWKEYEMDPLWRAEIHETRPKGARRDVYQYELIDTRSGRGRPLLNAPIGKSLSFSEVAWSSDSRSVVVTQTYLPLDVRDSALRKARQTRTFVAEVTIPDGQVVPIADRDLRLRRWDARTGKLLLETGGSYGSADVTGEIVAYQKAGVEWKEVPATAAELSPNATISVELEEDMNTPPRIFATDLKTGRKTLLLDLNPQFKSLRFGRVEDITFTATDGHSVKAGLYRPPNYVLGTRYPLVIQTHAWNPEEFWIDGPWSTAFAAQPLAGRGFVVAQLEEDLPLVSTRQEAPAEMSAYEGVIDYLEGAGLIQRDHVGIIGFSRTGFLVKYALTHSNYRFAAATVADGSDQGYLQYLAVQNAWPIQVGDAERVNGAVPFGDGLTSWLVNSPGFGLTRVATPIRLEGNGPASFLYNWEWFAGLRRLGKAVDFIYQPDAEHTLVKPWERLTSQQGNVDWFCFWLKGEEDANPSKSEQYARWRELRKLQQKQGDADNGATRH